MFTNKTNRFNKKRSCWSLLTECSFGVCTVLGYYSSEEGLLVGYVWGGGVPTQTEVVMTQNTDRLQWALHKQRPHYHAPALLVSLSMFHGKQCRIISAERRTNKQITRFPLSSAPNHSFWKISCSVRPNIHTVIYWKYSRDAAVDSTSRSVHTYSAPRPFA